MTKERIQKVIASTGLYSRRAVEKLIEERKIKVNGVIVTAQGKKVDPLTDRIQIDGKAFQYKKDEEQLAILFNKPRRVMVTRQDEKARTTVYDILPKEFSHLKPVGRLDFNTQGALILTNSGELILRLTHPKFHLDKVYEIKTTSQFDEKKLKRLERGILLDGKRTLPAKVKIQKSNKASTILEITLQEGKNRQIRRMCDAVGIVVKELKRVSIGPIKLKSLRSGQFRYLTQKELGLL